MMWSVSSILSICVVLLFGSCADDKPDVFMTKSGLYGSLEGEFIAKFPSKPNVLVQKNSLGNVEFDGVNFISSVGIEHDYHVSYVDYPEVVLEGWEIEDLFDQSAEIASKRSDIFDRLKKFPVESEEYEKQADYIFRSSKPNVTSLMRMRLLKSDKRIYTVTFIAMRNIPEQEEIDEFIDSFRIYKPNKL